MTSSNPTFDSIIDVKILQYLNEVDGYSLQYEEENPPTSFVEYMKILNNKGAIHMGGATCVLIMLFGSAIDDLKKLSRVRNTELYAIHQSIKEIQEEIKEKKLRDLLQEENLLLQVGKTTEIENRIKCIEEQQKVYITKFEQALKERKTQEQLEEEYVLSNVIDKTEIQNRINCIEEQQKDFIRTIYTLKVIIFGLICLFCLYTSNGYWKENNTQTCKYLLE